MRLATSTKMIQGLFNKHVIVHKDSEENIVNVDQEFVQTMEGVRF